MSLRKHTTYNLLGAVLPIGLSLVTIPIYIRLVGDARYGVLAVVWSFLGYFSLFDLGLGQATAQRVAAVGKSSPELIAPTFWTALAMNGALGALGGLLIWPISVYFFGHVISINDELRPELASALPWLMLAVPLTTMNGVLSGALQGRSQFLELNVISATSTVLLQIIPLCVAFAHGPDLAWLLPSVVLTRVLSAAALAWRCKLHVFQNRGPTFARAHAKSLVMFGGWVSVSSIVGPLMVVLDRFVIGAILGVKSVTYYTVPFQLAERSTILPNAATSALFPRLAMATGKEGRDLTTRAVHALAAIMTPVIVVALLLVEPFFRLWLGAEFTVKTIPTAHILLLSYWIVGFAFVPYAQLQASGRPDVTAKFHLLELIPYLLLLFLGLHFFGLPGAAAAFGVRNVVDCFLLMRYAGVIDLVIGAIRTSATLLIGAAGVALYSSVGSPAWWCASIAILLATLAQSWFCAPKDLRAWVIHLFKTFSFKSQGASIIAKLLKRIVGGLRRRLHLSSSNGTLSQRFPQYQFGEGTYCRGSLTIMSWGEGTTLQVGNFTSISTGVKIVLGGEHRTDWVTTFPFSVLWESARFRSGHPKSKGDVLIGNDVWIGTDALITSGVKIGDGAVVGARAVVTRDVSPYAIVAGNPAKLVRLRFDVETIERLLTVKWWNWEHDLLEKAMPDLLSDDIKLFLDRAESGKYL